MSAFKEISVNEIKDNPFKLIGSDWGLVAAKDGEKCNMMTVSWGGVGIMWNKPVAFTFIRPQRYSFGLLENEEYFTISFFDENYRKALSFCGSKSGRDYDKAKETGLTPLYDEKAPYFKEARLVLVCRKMYAQFLNEESVVDADTVLKNYDNDYHKMYISEIVKVLKNED
ncbi:MAG: flavin reductase family protein [Ruminococcus sp.]|nr:flavin reductase family protein [Ruminococcus sp.]